MTTLALVALLASPQESPTKTFVTTDRLLEMQIPKSWTVKKERSRQIVSFPTQDGTVRIEVYATQYLQGTEGWQTMQRTVNEQMKRTIIRQWDEDIMAVPMLLTSLKYNEPKEGDLGVLIGMIYTNTAEKSHFRLVAPLASLEAAESQWREAWLTLRTSSGKAPSVEDGNAESVSESKPIADGVTLSIAAAGPKHKPLGPVTFGFVTSGRSGFLRLPKGADVTDGKPALIKWAGLEGIQLTIYSNDDSPASALFLMQEVNKDLDRYKTVSLRENFGPKKNSVGLDVLSIVRTGVTETGDLQSFAAAGDNGKFYWVLKSETANAKEFKHHQDSLLKLVGQLGFEPTP